MRRRGGAWRALVVAVLPLILVGCGRDQPVSSLVGTTTFAPADRVQMPDLVGSTLTGEHLDLADLRGKVVVLNAWASWCGPCVDEVPALVQLDKAWDPADVALIGLDVSDDASAAKAFADQAGVTYPSITDPDGSMLPTIPGVPPRAVPSTVVIDRDGRLAARVVGEIDRTALDGIVREVADES